MNNKADLFGGHIANLAFIYCETKEYEKSLEYFVELFKNPDFAKDVFEDNLSEIKKYFGRVYKRFPNDERLLDIVKRYPKIL